MQKTEKIGKWILQHVIKMLIHFIIVFIPVSCVMAFVFKFDIQAVDYLINFVTLRLPGSTVWYFKIQILFYIILAVSMSISKKYACVTVAVLSLCYGLTANFVIGLPDYWWKTSLCFMAGCYIARYKDNVEKILKRNTRNLVLLFVGCLAYCAILKDSHYNFILQSMAYMVLSFCITMVWDWFVKGNIALQRAGKYSLDIYLVHIGFVEGIFLMNLNLNLKIMVFIISVAIITVLCYQISEYINKNIQNSLCMK